MIRNFRNSKIIFSLILFAIFIGISLFFAQKFSALEKLDKKQEKNIQTSQEDFNWNPSDETSDKKTSIPISDREEKNEPLAAVQKPIVKKDIPEARAQNDEYVIPNSPAGEEESQSFSSTTTESLTSLGMTDEKQLPQPQNIVTPALTAVRAIDGDTLVLSDGKTVRLIGINTPEKDQPYYLEAKNKLKELTEGKEVRLKKDISDTDRYGRLLRYVYIYDLFVNLEMVKSGLANSYAYPPDITHRQDFISAETFAREKGLGLWKKYDIAQSITLIQLHADAQGSDTKNMDDEYVVLKNISTNPLSLSHWSIKDAGTHIYTFPNFTLLNGATLTLYSGKGTNTEKSLYWNSKDPVWNNDTDTFYLRTASGELVIEYAYSVP